MRVVLTACLLLCYIHSFSQKTIGWLAPGQVASKIYGNLHPRIQLDKFNNPMVVWGDDAGKAWFAKWGGEAFATPEQLNIPGSSVFATSWSGPDIAAKGDTVYVVYKGMPDEKGHLFITHSYDGGVHFSVPEQMEPDGGSISRFPVVTADNDGNPFVSYLKIEKDNTRPRVVVNRSDDLGESFKGEIAGSILNDGHSCECSPTAMAVSGNAAMLLYRANQGGLRNIYASLSTEGALRFNYGMQIDSTAFTPTSCPASGPDCQIVGDNFYGVYTSGQGDNGLAYLLKMPLSTREIKVTPITGEIPGIVMQNFPRIAGAANAAAVVWTQTAAGNNQVCLSFTDNLASGFPLRYDTVADGVMINADVAVGGGFIYVVWEDQINRCVMFRRGVYVHKATAAENTSIIINSPPKGQKYFLVNQEGIISCTLTDEKDNHYEVDISYPNGNTFCKVATDDMETGTYTVKVWDSEGRTFTGKVTLP